MNNSIKIRWFLALVFIPSMLFAFSLVSQARIINSGNCGVIDDERGLDGSQITWRLDDNGMLTISGSGDMADYSTASAAPWANDLVTDVCFEEGVEKVGDYSFCKNTRLATVLLSDSIKTIGSHSFYDCSQLNDVIFPEGLHGIGSYAFHNCKKLSEIVIPDQVSEIGEWAFRNCSGLSAVKIGSGLSALHDRLFSGCSGLRSIVIPDGVERIGQYAFYVCSGLQYVSLPQTVTTIDHKAFARCTGLSFIFVPESVTAISDTAFEECSIRLYGNRDSYVCQWAENQGHPFIEVCAAAHNWEQTSVIQPATCRSAGVAQWTCASCGLIKEETIEKTDDHRWDGGRIIKTASVEEPGIRLLICSVCGAEQREPVTITEAHVHSLKEETLIGYRDQKYHFKGQCEICGAEAEKEYDAVISFVDDDGKADALAHWEKIIDSTGVRMNSAIITGKIPDKTSASNPYSIAGWDMIDRLKEKGVEFVCHTNGHIKLTEKTPEEIHEDLKAAKATMRAHGLNDEIIVYPFLAYNNQVISIVSRYFSMGVGGLRCMNAPGTDRYRICRIAINDKTRRDNEFKGKTVSSYTIKSLEQLKAHVAEAIAEKQWFVFKSHAYNSTVNYWFDEEDEQTVISLIRYIQSLPNVKIITLSEAYPILNGAADTHELDHPVIVTQPQSCTFSCDKSSFTTTAFADGDDLTYQWYDRRGKNADFEKNTTATHEWYAITNKNTEERQAYCVITDGNGRSVQTETITLSVSHTWDDGTITKEGAVALSPTKKRPGSPKGLPGRCFHSII